jgi:hypothetical protein
MRWVLGIWRMSFMVMSGRGSCLDILRCQSPKGIRSLNRLPFICTLWLDISNPAKLRRMDASAEGDLKRGLRCRDWRCEIWNWE